MPDMPTEITAPTETHEDGFTLVEVLVTMTIIGIMIAVVAVNVIPRIGEGNTTRVKSDLASLETALELYRLDMFDYPSQIEGLAALSAAPAGVDPARYQQGGYIKKGNQMMDPWGNPYQYRYPGENGLIDIFSLGADGEPGGEGAAADIGNWQ